MVFSASQRTSRAGLIFAAFMLMPAAAVTLRAQGTAVPPALARNGAARDVISEEALRKQVATMPKIETQVGAMALPHGKTAPVIEKSLWAHSLILFDGERCTIIPEGSILHLPKALQSKLIPKTEGKFLLWPYFLKRNESWLAAKEVTLEMAKGDARQAEEVLATVATDNRAVVAVYKGGPIMILEPQTSPDPATDNTRSPEAAGNKPVNQR